MIDRVKMAGATCDEVIDPSTGLVTRNALRAELAQLRTEISCVKLRLTRHQCVVGGAVIVILGLLNFAG
ncbi:MAG: hypothetical protein R3349_01860, partial [Geminicoccaceae bacterium]|nr:hypothetical protein [Geminicoccaceae bacterium]